MSHAEPEVVKSTKPYLIRAIYDWTLDEGLTPQVMVDVEVDNVVVPLNYAKDGKIVLNLHPNSVRGLEVGNQYLLFSARFAGRAEDITIPVAAVMAVYARENGQGIVFQPDGSGVTPPPPGKEEEKYRENAADTSDSNTGQTGKIRQGAHLTIVK